jgi:hypothetical protein
MWTKCGCLTLLLVSVLATTGDDLRADDKPSQKMSGWQRLFRKHAAGYKIVVEGDDGGDASLVPEPILQWSQPVRGGADGAVFVWALEGRPVAIGTFFIWPTEGRQGVAHELHSLSQSPLVANWRDRRWTPPRDSVVWKPIPAAPVPAATGEQRLRQMRDLSRQFTAESHDKDDRRWDLRPLARPIFRYGLDRKQDSAATDREVLDGALFGFVEGTDLEIVLSLEARKTTTGYRWEYALSRMSDFRLVAKLGETTVWEVEPYDHGRPNPRAAYYGSTVETRTSADDE